MAPRKKIKGKKNTKPKIIAESQPKHSPDKIASQDFFEDIGLRKIIPEKNDPDNNNKPTHKKSLTKIQETENHVASASVRIEEAKVPKYPGLSGRHRRKSLKPLHRKEKVLKEIKLYRKSSKLLISKQPFRNVIKEILFSFVPEDFRIQPIAIEALQESAELYLVQLFEDSYIVAKYAGRSTLFPGDIKLVRYLRGVSHIGN